MGRGVDIYGKGDGMEGRWGLVGYGETASETSSLRLVYFNRLWMGMDFKDFTLKYRARAGIQLVNCY